jgi:hypothetical protein
MVMKGSKVRGPNTPEEIKYDILLLKKADFNDKLTAKVIRTILVKLHPKSKNIPKERAISNIIQKNRDNIEFEPKDYPWTIGSCDEYNIPGDFIPILIQMQSVAKALDRDISIRQAKWIVRLYPSVCGLIDKKSPSIATIFAHAAIYAGMEIDNDDEIVKLFHTFFKNFENQNDEVKLYISRLTWLAIIGIQYAKQEQINEISGRAFNDTSKLDEVYFIKRNISTESFIDGLKNAFIFQGQRTQNMEETSTFNADELEPLLGKLNSNQLKILNDFAKATAAGYVAAQEWKKQHPIEWEELNKIEAKENELHQTEL